MGLNVNFNVISSGVSLTATYSCNVLHVVYSFTEETAGICRRTFRCQVAEDSFSKKQFFFIAIGPNLFKIFSHHNRLIAHPDSQSVSIK